MLNKHKAFACMMICTMLCGVSAAQMDATDGGRQASSANASDDVNRTLALLWQLWSDHIYKELIDADRSSRDIFRTMIMVMGLNNQEELNSLANANVYWTAGVNMFPDIPAEQELVQKILENIKNIRIQMQLDYLGDGVSHSGIRQSTNTIQCIIAYLSTFNPVYITHILETISDQLMANIVTLMQNIKALSEMSKFTPIN